MNRKYAISYVELAYQEVSEGLHCCTHFYTTTQYRTHKLLQTTNIHIVSLLVPTMLKLYNNCHSLCTKTCNFMLFLLHFMHQVGCRVLRDIQLLHHADAMVCRNTAPDAPSSLAHSMKSFIHDHYSLILPFTCASATSERDVVCGEVEQLLSQEQNTLTMDPASTLTAFYAVHVACSITDDARKMDVTSMLDSVVTVLKIL